MFRLYIFKGPTKKKAQNVLCFFECDLAPGMKICRFWFTWKVIELFCFLFCDLSVVMPASGRLICAEVLHLVLEWCPAHCKSSGHLCLHLQTLLASPVSLPYPPSLIPSLIKCRGTSLVKAEPGARK